jgi:hypothetical protein
MRDNDRRTTVPLIIGNIPEPNQSVHRLKVKKFKITKWVRYISKENIPQTINR